MHPLLQRQIKKHLGSDYKPTGEIKNLLEAVSDAYYASDEGRILTERSLEISSKELTEINERLHADVKKQRQDSTEMEKLNKVMVDRELKMVQLKKQIKDLQDKLKNK